METGLEIGATVLGYRVESLIGRGGMGFVYKAEHLGLGRKAALKILAPELSGNAEFRSRFVLESRTAARLEHPNIVPIYEAGESGGILYIAMRYVDGADLGTLLARHGRLAPARALELLGQVANALDAAHRQGMVHRDVKPANVLVERPSGPEGPEHAWLCDFGLVKPVNAPEAGRLTGTGVFMGTIQYVAPEQIEGRELDGRADVYALGCVLYECLTGVVPFERDGDVATLYAHLHDPPPTTGALGDLPAGLGAVFATAMAKAPADRYATCTDLVGAARVALAARQQAPTAPATRPAPPAPAPAEVTRPLAPPPAPGPPGRRRGRARRWVVAGVLVGLAAVVAAAFGLGLVPDAWTDALTGGGANGGAGGGRVDCVGGFTTPTVGTPARKQPLDAIRAGMAVTGEFVVADMRMFDTAGGTRWWYVKANQAADPTFKGRWLLRGEAAGPRIVAAAKFASRGFAGGDWLGFRGTAPRRSVPGLPGRWAGPSYDYVAAGELPAEVRGCLDGT